MSKTDNVIALNGKYYDVASGVLLPDQAVAPRHTATMRHVEVVKRPRLGHHAEKPAHPAVPRTHTPIAAHKPSRSTTLMRHAVKQPAIDIKPAYKPQAPLSKALQKHVDSLPAVVAKPSSSRINPARASHAAVTPHSDMIRRFAAAPVYGHHRAAGRPAMTDVRQTTRPTVERPVMNAHAKPDHRPVHQPAPRTAPAAAKPAETDIFSQALAAAASHAEKGPRPVRHKKTHSRRKLAGAGLAVAILLAFGAIALLNRPALEVQFASMRAGFAASLPGYQPEGYSVKDLAYGPGAVTVGFQGPGQESFDIAQKKSNWDSQTLLDNFVATSDESYQAYQANGRTVFVYGDNAATWVNGGVWYQLKGNLSADEMIKIAATM